MKPEDVPAELVDMLADPLTDDAHENCEETGCPGNVRPYFEDLARWVLADLIPEIQRQERAAIAKGLKHYFAASDDPLYEDVRILCGRIERGEYSTRPAPAVPPGPTDQETTP